jgi:hypothetical protein
MKVVVALVAGLLFGSGLLLSGMADPARVLAFLDLAAGSSPLLALTMAAAIAVAAPAFWLARRRGQALDGTPVSPLNRAPIDTRLVGGSVVFGIGWGLSGICPAPGLLLAAARVPGGEIFLIGLVVGIYAVDSIAQRRAEASRLQCAGPENGLNPHAS